MEGLEGPGAGTEDYSLLAAPSGSSKDPKATKRSTASYENLGERFKLEKRTFGNQYAQIYFFRLQRLAPHMRSKIQKHWPGVPVKGVLDLPENQEVAIIGTLYKEMKLKPSILAEYTKDKGLEQLIGKAKFTDPSDSAILEDESARVQLRGAALPIGDLVTGLVMAVRGTAVPGGDFWVTEVLYPGLRAQKALPAPSGPPQYVALVSGLAVGDPSGNPTQLSLLVDYLTGMLGTSAEQIQTSQIVRTVIAGELMCNNDALASANTHSNATQQTAALGPLREMDISLSELASSMPVDVMPGLSDPASRSLPQQPLHHCLFPGAAAFKTLQRVTNPHEFSINGVTFLGTSGQNVEDIYKYSIQEDRAGILEAILEWGHLVPTAPDTLSSYPFALDDPFLLEDAPHVLFAGNQPEFQTRLVEGIDGQKVRLVCIPRFSETGVLVLVNLASLEVQSITFDAMLE